MMPAATSTHANCNRKPSRGCSKLRQRVRELMETEISFVFRRTDSGGQTHDLIDDPDGFLNEIEHSRSGLKATQRPTGGRSLMPVPDYLLSAEQERRLFLTMNDLKCRANALRSRLDPRRPSLARVDEIDQLLRDAGRIQHRLCECNLRLVISIARKLSNSQTHFEELVSDGLPILMRCVELFDASRGYRFSTYVTHSVQRHLYRVIHRAQKQKKRFPATDDEILRNVAMDSDGPSEPMPDHAAIVSAILDEADAELDARERLIIHRRFGLDGDGSQTLRQIAGELGISKERVRQLQLRAMDKLQDIALSMNVDADLL